MTILGQPTSYLELAGIITGLWGVWLTVRKNILCFPVGIINVAIYAILFSSEGIRLYADALLQCIYLILLIYGWTRWKHGEDTEKVEKVKGSEFLKVIAIGIISFIGLSFFFENFTDASFPWLDSALTIISLIAQWMIAKKLTANWLLWIVADLIYIPLYMHKGLPFTACLYFLFLILAIKGYLDWKKNERPKER